eukprot:COSAG06_NODE_212_length_20143_cov_16.516713_16_plen_137_part_00
MALSNDTLTWTKPILGNVAFENSTANNIILGAGGYIEPGTVFVDNNPSVQAHEKFKMVASYRGGATMFSSADGFLFTPMTPKPSLTGSDTQDVVFCEPRLISRAAMFAPRATCCLLTILLGVTDWLTDGGCLALLE